MKIDFSAIDNIEPKIADNDFKELSQPNSIDAGQKPLKNDFKGHTARNDMLLIQANEKKREKEREKYSEYCKTIAENRNKTSEIKTHIIDCMEKGYSISSLFLEACKAISLCTNDKLFYEQAEAKLFDVYAKGLEDAEAKDLLAGDIGHRIRRLQQANIKEPNNKNIKNALKAHKAEYERITGDKL